MKKLPITLLALMLNAVCVVGALAEPTSVFELAEWATNKDGVVADTLIDPNLAFTSKTFSLNFTGAGSHTAIGFVDAEIDQATNTFFNEFGAANGAPVAGQTWEIDEPGYVFGDIFDNVSLGSLDNSNGVDASVPDDVSMALGWDFILGVDESAVASFFLSNVAPSSGFYLSQTDPDSQATLYYYSTLEIQPCSTEGCDNGGGPTVPEPATLALLGIAMAGMLVARRASAKA